MYVYFLLAVDSNFCLKRNGLKHYGSFIKIGKSKNLYKRYEDLVTGCPYDLYSLGMIKCKGEEHSFYLEKYFHSKFKEFHYNKEWFVFTKKQIESITNFCNFLSGKDLNDFTEEEMFNQINIFFRNSRMKKEKVRQYKKTKKSNNKSDIRNRKIRNKSIIEREFSINKFYEITRNF